MEKMRFFNDDAKPYFFRYFLLSVHKKFLLLQAFFCVGRIVTIFISLFSFHSVCVWLCFGVSWKVIFNFLLGKNHPPFSG